MIAMIAILGLARDGHSDNDGDRAEGCGVFGVRVCLCSSVGAGGVVRESVVKGRK